MHFEYMFALLALGHAVAAQNSSYTVPPITSGSSSIPLTTTSSPSPTSSSSNGIVGAETVSLVEIATLARHRRGPVAPRQALVENVFICPIYAQQVPGAPCYPCAVGEPTAQQTLLVQTTSTLGAVPDPTPIFLYSFCEGCEATEVTIDVPGYTPGSRNFATCLGSPVTSTSTSSPTPTPTPTSSHSRHPGKPGITTNINITATIFNLIQIVSYCPTNGVRKTHLEQSTTCSTYSTLVTIPPELCTTSVSTKNGVVVTYTTPVSTWTQILTTAVTSTVSTITVTSPTPVATVVPAGYTPVETSAAAAVTAAAPAESSAAAAAAAAPAATTEGSSPAEATYVTAGAGQAFASVSAIVLSVFAFLLV